MAHLPWGILDGSLHEPIKLVPYHKEALLEEYEAVGERIEKDIEALGELLRPRLDEVGQVQR